MPGWLSRIDERSQRIETLSGSFEAQRSVYVVLDQRRAPERCAALVGQPGWHDYLTLFAGTPLSPLLEASPWLVELTPGSEAWQAIGSLCAGQRHGWLFQPAQATSLSDMADRLRRLFILDDPHGGQSLVNLQDAAAWTALLAASSDTAYAQLIGPLGQVITPTPLTHWQRWQPAVERNEAEAPALTEALEQALKESPRAWWLSRATETPLSALPPVWMERLGHLAEGGITYGRDRKRLLPLIRQAGDDTWHNAQHILSDLSLTEAQRISELERLS
ncbi:DUF4123 domain-containing protein [Halomonas sp. KM-1]|uniref:DUF4123 domain-containing protein n=1 Tax=Halomonas sp. KM-1 TaxID=590061 RepID=UPI0002896B91|nr:DUF4123 domain-containing protein [Halomonas sp. KM-1]